jgi:hypothetical protein
MSILGLIACLKKGSAVYLYGVSIAPVILFQKNCNVSGRFKTATNKNASSN